MATCLLKADIVQLLNFIPEGTRLPCNLERCRADSEHPKTLIKAKEGFVSARTGKMYPFTYAVRDVETHVLSLGTIIEKAELNPEFNLALDRENGQLYAYSGYMDNIQDNRNGQFLRTDAMYVFKTYMPKQLVDQGLADAPIKISGYVFDKVRATFSRGDYFHGHHFDKSDLLKIRDAIDDPVAIIKCEAPDGGVRLAVITTVPDFKDNLSMVILQSDDVTQDSCVCSVYGKNNIIDSIHREQNFGNLLYLGDTKVLKGQATTWAMERMLKEIVKKYDKDHPKERMANIKVNNNKPQKKRGGQRL